MSRRPGPDLDESNGHGRSTFLAVPRPMTSNLFFTASNGESPAELRKKFLDACKQNGQAFGLVVREMDNPVIASSTQEELSDSLATLASGAPNGDRMPLLVYRVNVNDGREELVRGALISRLTVRNLRAAAGHRQRQHDLRVSSRARMRRRRVPRWARLAPLTAGCRATSLRHRCYSRRSKSAGRTGSRGALLWCRLRRCNRGFPGHYLAGCLGADARAKHVSYAARLARSGTHRIIQKVKSSCQGRPISPPPTPHPQNRWPRSVRWVRPLFSYR